MASHAASAVVSISTLGLVVGTGWFAVRYRVRWARSTGRLGDILDGVAAVAWGLLGSGLLGLLVLTTTRGSAR